MESIKGEVAPLLLLPESWEVPVVPAALGIKTKLSNVKLKQSRYDDIWSEDVHAAFMEAIAIYPPMGKRRLRYVRILKEDRDETAESSHLVKSFGRCQLIQSYILEKTGKNRTRKQVSSHLQRLKKKYKSDPIKRVLFLEISQLTQEHPDREEPALSSAGIQTDTTPPLSLFSDQASPFSGIVRDGLEEQKRGATSANSVNESYFTYYHVDNKRHLFGEQEKVSNASIVPQVGPTLPMGIPTENSVSSDSEFSLSLRRLGNKLAPLSRQLEGPTTVYSSEVHCSPACVVTHDGSNLTMMDFPCNYPLTPVDQLLHTPLQPPQITRLEKRRVVPENVDGCWGWPVNAHTTGSPPDSDSYTPHAHTAELLLSLSDNSSEPSFNMNFMGDFHPEREDRHHARRLSYSHAYNASSSYAQDLFSQGFLHVLPTHPRFLPDLCPHAEETLATPLIKPIPLYPAAYTHSEDDTPDLSPAPAL
ncbi:TEA/ATTS domain family-domain-containing protein [Suillus variegatus]|nr:TEA/ATTS domain family-domain-containing protein [Suillus variegatus]